MQKILVIQTAFIGDAILASAVLEKLFDYFPNAKMDLLVRKGNESLYKDHPYLNKCLVWNKKEGKYNSLLKLKREIKETKYDLVVNLHRFASSGFLTAFSGAKQTVGFDKNPLSFLFTKKIKHVIGDGRHEVERNQQLIESFTDKDFVKPRLYPSQGNYDKVLQYQSGKYVCMAPSSVWFTKQLPVEKWIELCDKMDASTTIYMLGAPNDSALYNQIVAGSKNKNVVNLCGKLDLLDSCALMESAHMNYVNDSGPLHLASSMNAPTTAFFCSTVPAFGFTPLADNSRVIETNEILDCRPCGLHGFRACPKGHFKCGYGINVDNS